MLGAGDCGLIATLKNKKVIFVSLVLLAMSVSVYWPTLEHGFLEYDDDDYVTNNLHIQGGPTPEFFFWAFTSVGYAGNWHPVTWISHMVDFELFGMNPRGHHGVNILFHAANSITLFLVLGPTTGAFWKSASVAALWAVHPLHVESVARIAERKDLLSAFFWLLTILAYVLYTKKRSLKRYAAVSICFGFGLMAKPMNVTLPFVLLLFDYWPLRRIQSHPQRCIEYKAPPSSPVATWRSLVAEKLPLLTLSLITTVLTWISQHRGGMTASWEQFSLSDRLTNVLLSYVDYISNAVWPENLSPLYPHLGRIAPLQTVLVSGGVLLAVSALVLLARRRYPYLLTGWFWYLGTLVPVIGIVQVGSQGMADRYVYVPIIGLLIACVWASGALRDWRMARVINLVLAVAVIASFAIVARRQVAFWQSDLLLYERAVQTTENNWLAEYNLGVFLEKDGRHQEAMRRYLNSIDIYSGFPDAHLNLGALLARLGRDVEATKHYRRVLELAPNLAVAHFNLGNALQRQKRFKEAIASHREAVRLEPRNASALTHLGVSLYLSGHVEEAIEVYEASIRLDSSSAACRYNLGLALEVAGRAEEAILNYRQALRLRPDYPNANISLARIIAKKGP